MKVTSMYCPGTRPSEKQPAKCSNVEYPVKGNVAVGKGYGDPAYGDDITDNNAIQVSPSYNATPAGTEGVLATAGAVKGSLSTALVAILSIMAMLLN